MKEMAKRGLILGQDCTNMTRVQEVQVITSLNDWLKLILECYCSGSDSLQEHNGEYNKVQIRIRCPVGLRPGRKGCEKKGMKRRDRQTMGLSDLVCSKLMPIAGHAI